MKLFLNPYHPPLQEFLFSPFSSLQNTIKTPFFLRDFFRQDKVKMVKKPGDILVCLMIVSLDATAAILGIQADVSQYNQVKDMRMWGLGCKEPSQVAYRLGLAATILMGLAHVLTHLVGGCMCVCSQDELQRASPHRKLSMGCLVFSWIILAVGFSMLVIGTMWNKKSTATCDYSHHFLSIGGVMCFIHALVCVAYYASAIDAVREEAK